MERKIFLSFESQDERRNYGGSCFVELQFCRLPMSAPIEKIVAVSSIRHWKDDSLYVSDDSRFFNIYSSIFNGGVYCNLQSGIVDTYGINYYDPALTEVIIQRLLSEKPEDHERLVEWLKEAGAYNGFYVLGI